VQLRSKAASALAMALHELATNAVKYGALSNESGRIDVRWRVESDTLELTWIERGGPPVSAPASTGFGTVLISRVLQAETRGKVSTEFAPEGLTFRLTAPVAEVVAPADRE
jgi:two-component sensor histidine kinase